MLVDEDAKAVALLSGLERLVASLADVSVPATIVLISEGLHLGVREAMLGRLARDAGASRVTVHVVKPALAAVDIRDHTAPPSPAAEEAVLRDGLEKLADQMGGEFRIAVSSGDAAFASVATELSGYYLLGIEPLAADRTGRPRDIRVSVSRRGTRAIARRFFVVEDAAPRRFTGPAMERLLVSAVPASGVPLKVATYQTLDDDPDNVRVLLSAEIGSPVEAARLLDVGFVLLDDSGRVVRAESGRLIVNPARDGVPSPSLYVTGFSARPGTYVVRFGAIAPEGNEGSVHHTLRLALTRKPRNLLLSDLLVGVEPASGGPPRFTPSAIVDGPRAAAVLQIATLDRSPRAAFPSDSNSRRNAMARCSVAGALLRRRPRNQAGTSFRVSSRCISSRRVTICCAPSSPLMSRRSSNATFVWSRDGSRISGRPCRRPSPLRVGFSMSTTFVIRLTRCGSCIPSHLLWTAW